MKYNKLSVVYAALQQTVPCHDLSLATYMLHSQINYLSITIFDNYQIADLNVSPCLGLGTELGLGTGLKDG